MILLQPSTPPDEGDLPSPKGRSEEEQHHDFQRYLTAAARTVDYLEKRGLDATPSSDDLTAAAAMALAYARDPMTTAKKTNTVQKVSALPPPAVREAHRILTAFGHNVVRDATQVRHMVTNKLIEEAENSDPRVRLKALELLGKISDVGLFAEKSEVTITHQTSDELRARLRDRLASVIDATKEKTTTSTTSTTYTEVEDIPEAQEVYEAHETYDIAADDIPELDTSLWDD